ncbi:MAG TPA: cold-shock protein [Thermohalobaculum sp.]|nr:cold-shock protein [Thermohalobaculum sp.]
MPTGKVKWFNQARGFGFIQPDDGGKDVFVHISEIKRAGMETLAEDQPVVYELSESRDGRSMAGSLSAS